MDTSTLCGTHELEHVLAATRDTVAADAKEIQDLARYRAVSGHFSLPTLLEITAPAAVGTIMREPRARVVSLYLYWRIPHTFEAWRPYRTDRYALQPLHRFMAEPRIAPAIDNQVCRLLLHGDARIPASDFIAAEDIDTIAADAIARLQTLGFVGVLELGDSAWQGLSQLFDVALEPRFLNATGEQGNPLAAPPGEPLITATTLDLIERRSAADRIVYDHALALSGVHPSERLRLAETAFASEIVLLGDLLGRSATQLPERTRAIEQARAALAQQDQLYAQVVELRTHLDACEQLIQELHE